MEKPTEKRGRILAWCRKYSPFFVVLGVLVPVLLFAFGAFKGCNSDKTLCRIENCSGSDKKNSSMRNFLVKNGYDRSSNHEYPYQKTVSIKEYATDYELSKPIEELREKSFKQAIQWAESIQTYNLGGYLSEFYSGEKQLDYNRILDDLTDENKKADLKNILTIYSFEEKINCRECAFEYNVTFATPKDKEIVIPSQIRRMLKGYTSESPTFSKFKQQDFSEPIDETINLVNILKDILLKDRFKEDFKTLLDEHHGYIKYLDEETSAFFDELITDTVKIDNFPPGSYNLSSVMTFLVNEIAEVLLKGIRDNPAKSWEITITGYADPSPIGKPLPYPGKGRWLEGKSIMEKDNNQGTPINPSIENNTELSYARAYSGLMYLKDKLNLKLPKNIFKKVSFIYKGAGVDLTEELDKWQKRRIEIHIKSN